MPQHVREDEPDGDLRRDVGRRAECHRGGRPRAGVDAARPQITAYPLTEERLQRTVFTAARASAADSPAVVAVRDALRQATAVIAPQRDNAAVT